ncbi:hypothetical protein HanIR_Chr03g0134391 [Helianthus annuus]|nr:hypothetical protein HanIR_Chr03g0134391 [Helianthus annuus]
MIPSTRLLPASTITTPNPSAGTCGIFVRLSHKKSTVLVPTAKPEITRDVKHVLYKRKMKKK